MLKKEKLETSDRIYYRILWDNEIDTKKTQITYLDYGRMKTIPYHEWIPMEKGGEIPWHRIHKMLYRGNVFWDRDARIYNESILFDTGHYSNMTIIPPTISNLFLDSKLPERFTIFSLNCLFDFFHKSITDVSLRLPLIVQTILEKDADVVCLQEITPEMRKYIIESNLNKHYYISGNEPKKYGQMMLSKVKPISQNLIMLDGNYMKKYLQMTFQLDNGQFIEIYNVHLTSDQQKSSEKKRNKQIEQLFSDSTSENFIFTGDFNSSKPIEKEGILDAWTELRPDEDGFTYDFQVNGLANKTSVNKLQARIDRMLYKGIKAIDIHVTCDKEPWVSDHFGLVGTFSLDGDIDLKVQNVKPMVKPGTALDIILDFEHWLPINQYRCLYDNSFQSWPPHITIFQRFVQVEDWYEIQKDIKDIVSNEEPNNIIFDQVTIFELTQNFAVVLTSSIPSSLLKQREEINKKVEMSIESTPHISLGTFDDEKKAKSVAAEAQIMLKNHGPFQIPLNCHALMKKIGQQFQVYDVIGRPTKIDPLIMTKQLCQIVDPSNLQFELVGSRNYGITSTDYDLVIFGELESYEFREKVVRYAKMSPHFKFAEAIESQVPIINLLTYDNIEMNVIYEKQKVKNQLIENMISVPKEVINLTGGRFESFCSCYRMVHNWAHAREIYGSNYGYFNGLTWLILTLNVFLQKQNISREDFILDFFKYYATCDWKSPININGLPLEDDMIIHQFLIVANIVKPADKIIRTLSRLTWDKIKEEFRRAHIIGKDFQEIMKRPKIEKPFAKIVLAQSFIYDRIQEKNRITSKLWKIPIVAGGAIPSTRWITKEDYFEYRFPISQASDTVKLGELLDCPIEFRF